jgi:hypothetical protein
LSFPGRNHRCIEETVGGFVRDFVVDVDEVEASEWEDGKTKWILISAALHGQTIHRRLDNSVLISGFQSSQHSRAIFSTKSRVQFEQQYLNFLAPTGQSETGCLVYRSICSK